MKRIVKSLLSSACCQAGAIILNSSLLTLNSLAATVIGGEVGPFVSWPDAVTADEKHTPGSEEFYDEVDEMTVYDSGIVYRNGTVVTNVPFPQVVASMEDDSDYGWCYDFSQSIGPGERLKAEDKRRKAIRMHQFDVSWTAHSNDTYVAYYAYGTGSVTKTISPSVMLPVSRRLDEDTRSALLATYEAYCERLYWGSKGDTNKWDETYYGSMTPGPSFKFNFVQGYTNFWERTCPTNDMRLLEYPEFSKLREYLQRLFPSGRITHDLRDRNVWLPHPTYSAYNRWWSSSKLPRLESQNAGNGKFAPAAADFTLLPTCDWTNSDVRADASLRWPCRGWTLDALNGGHGFSGQTDDSRFPCSVLLKLLEEEVTYHYPDANVPRWQAEDTFPDFLTNVYVYAAKQSVNPTNAFGKYAASWENDTRRLKPSSYAGVNQLLAVMDRTIDVNYNDLHYDKYARMAFNRGDYVDSAVPTGYWNGASFLVDYGFGQHTLSRTSITNGFADAERGSDIGTGPSSCGDLIIYDLDQRGFRVDVQPAIGMPSLPISIDLAYLYYVGYEIFNGQFLVTDIGLSDINTVTLHCLEIDDGQLFGDTFTGELDVSNLTFAVTQEEFAPLACQVTRSYNFYNTNRVYFNDNYHLTHPPIDAGDRVRESKYALAWLRVVDDEKWWKFDEEKDYTRSNFANLLLNSAAEVTNDLNRLASSFYDGKNYLEPGTFAPLPSSVRVDVDRSLEYAKSSYAVAELDDYPYDLSLTMTNITQTFEIPYTGYDVTNVTTVSSNVALKAETYAVVYEEVAPDGWRWVTRATTNVVSTSTESEHGTTSSESVTVVSIAWTNMLERTIWPTDPQNLDVELEEHTNRYSQTVREVVTEVKHYGKQTNVVAYYDHRLVVTNAVTNVTDLSYSEITTNSVTRTAYLGTEFRYWNETKRPLGTIENEVIVETYEYLAFKNGVPYIAYIDPATYEVVFKYPAPDPLYIGNASLSLSLIDRQPFYVSTNNFPPMAHKEFSAREAFHPITRVDWNWKSMHDKGH